MGISGLLPFLKDATTSVNIKQFEGATVAVDTYCWIYRGAFSCAEELAISGNADGHVKYVLKYVNKLLEWNIKPVMIFDGSCLPSKKLTEAKRKESKEMYKRKAAQCLSEGRRNDARECFQRCIECTPKMALEVIKALHEIGVDVLVAPYEADAQLAYLNKINIAQIIITEDSDLILFGCEKVLYKLDLSGNGQLFQKEKIISITQFDSADNFERFRWMCILSGCDYLENLPGIGLGKARKLLKSIQKSDIEYILKMMPKTLKMPSLSVTPQYIESFKRADKTFKYQIVFDPLQRKLVPSNPYADDLVAEEDLSYAGFSNFHNNRLYDDSDALQHCLGNIDVNTRDIVYNFDPSKSKYKPPPKYANNPPAHMRSIWSPNYVSFKNSTPFGALMSKVSDKINRPSTLGLNKTISSKSIDTNKRKFEQFNSQSSSSSSSSADSDYVSQINENEDAESTNKRSRTEVPKSDIDELINDYTINENKSPSSPNILAQSPIVNKNSEKRLSFNPELLDNLDKSPLCNTQSPYFDKNSDTKLNDSTNCVAFKLKSFSKKTSKFSFGSPLQASTAPTLKMVIENTPEKKPNVQESNLEETRTREETTKSVLKDLDDIIFEGSVNKPANCEKKILNEKTNTKNESKAKKDQATLLDYYKYQNANKLGKVSK